MKIKFCGWLAATLLVALPLACRTAKTKPASAYGSAADSEVEGAPEIPELAVLRPFIRTTAGGNDAGTTVGTACGVAIDATSPIVVLTAFTVLGPDSGFTMAPDPNKLNSLEPDITFGDAFGSSDGVFDGEDFLQIPEAGSEADSESPAGNVLAIRLPEKSRIAGLSIAVEQPQAGDRVWMLSALFRGAPPSRKQHAATLSGLDERGNLRYTFENERLSFEGTLGAPIVNDLGEVVAIHLEGQASNGKLVGVGNPVSRFLPYLVASMQTTQHYESGPQ